MKKHAAVKSTRLGHPVRNFFARYTAVFLVFLAATLMIAGRAENGTVETVRMFVVDMTAPVLDVASRPVNSVIESFNSATDFTTLRSENIRLRAENLRLRQWYETALRLEAENKSLRTLLSVVPDPDKRFITARVVADAGGAFVRSFLVAAGREDGVRRGQAVMTGQGLIGRVTEVGDHTARVLMITDLNARIPVRIENTLHRAILAGDNTDLPRLLYLPPDSNIEKGARLVTSGHGGMLPPGLPVGVVDTIDKNTITVLPFADFSRLTHVQIVDSPPVRPLAENTIPVEEAP